MTISINPPPASQLAGPSLPLGLLASMAWIRHMQGWARPTHGLRQGGLHLATMACLQDLMARQRTLLSMIVGRNDGTWTVLTLNWQAVIVQQTQRSVHCGVASPATAYRESAVLSPRWKPALRTSEPDNQAATSTAAGLPVTRVTTWPTVAPGCAPAAHQGVGLATLILLPGLAEKNDSPLHRPTSMPVLQAVPPQQNRAAGQVPSGEKWSPGHLGMQTHPGPPPIPAELGQRLTMTLAAQSATALEHASQHLPSAGLSLPPVRQEWPATTLAKLVSNVADLADVGNAATQASSLGDLLFDHATRARGDALPSGVWQGSPPVAKGPPERVQQTPSMPHIDRDGVEQIAVRVMRIIKREQRRELEIKGRI